MRYKPLSSYFEMKDFEMKDISLEKIWIWCVCGSNINRLKNVTLDALWG